MELSRLPRDDQPRRVRAKEVQESEGGEEPDSGEVERHYDVNNVPALAGELDEGQRPQHHHRSAKVPRVYEDPGWQTVTVQPRSRRPSAYFPTRRAMPLTCGGTFSDTRRTRMLLSCKRVPRLPLAVGLWPPSASRAEFFFLIGVLVLLGVHLYQTHVAGRPRPSQQGGRDVLASRCRNHNLCRPFGDARP